MALTSAIVVAILFHRFWVLKYIYQPYVVYHNLVQLTEEEGIEEVWQELLECTYKSMNDKRLGDGKVFMKLLAKTYPKVQKKREAQELLEEIKSLYEFTSNLRPLARYMEVEWPFLLDLDARPTQTSTPHSSLYLEEAGSATLFPGICGSTAKATRPVES